ncbi:hypothetical protein DITRI_Ditri16bG0110100 [Diplodiscus trichospermus]
MAAAVTSSIQIAVARPRISSCHGLVKSGPAFLGANSKSVSWTKLTSACNISSLEPIQRTFTSSPVNFNKQNFLPLKVLKFLWELGFLLPDGFLMEITKVYPLDAVFDNLEDVPEDIKTNKRYAGSSNWTVQEAAESAK